MCYVICECAVAQSWCSVVGGDDVELAPLPEDFYWWKANWFFGFFFPIIVLTELIWGKGIVSYFLLLFILRKASKENCPQLAIHDLFQTAFTQEFFIFQLAWSVCILGSWSSRNHWNRNSTFRSDWEIKALCLGLWISADTHDPDEHPRSHLTSKEQSCDFLLHKLYPCQGLSFSISLYLVVHSFTWCFWKMLINSN